MDLEQETFELIQVKLIIHFTIKDGQEQYFYFKKNYLIQYYNNKYLQI